MKSLERKVAELRAEVERERKRELEAAAGRIMASLRAAFGNDLEDRLQGLSGRLLTESTTDADNRLLATLPAADLNLLGSTGPQYVVLMATVFGKY